jgi:hypothetical protein
MRPIQNALANKEEWTPEYVSPAISTWLRRRRDVIRLLMEIERDVFREAIAVVGRSPGTAPVSMDQVDVKRALDHLFDVSNLDAEVHFLCGFGMAPNLHALFNLRTRRSARPHRIHRQPHGSDWHFGLFRPHFSARQ